MTKTPKIALKQKGKAEAQDAAPAPKETKLARVAALLQRPEGASIAEMMAATGWQAHSVRGALAGALKKKGHTIVSEKTDGERRYRIEASS